MNSAAFHLLTNHIPILGALFTFILFLVGIIRKNKTLVTTALYAFVIVAFLTFPAFFSGEPAEEAVEHLPGVTHELIHEHEETAELSFYLMLGLGLWSGLCIFTERKKLPIFDLFTKVALFFAGLVCVCMIYTGSLGGKIRHTELNSSTAK